MRNINIIVRVQHSTAKIQSAAESYPESQTSFRKHPYEGLANLPILGVFIFQFSRNSESTTNYSVKYTGTKKLIQSQKRHQPSRAATWYKGRKNQNVPSQIVRRISHSPLEDSGVFRIFLGSPWKNGPLNVAWAYRLQFEVLCEEITIPLAGMRTITGWRSKTREGLW